MSYNCESSFHKFQTLLHQLEKYSLLITKNNLILITLSQIS